MNNYIAIDAAGSSLTVVLRARGKYYTFKEQNLRRTSAVLLPSVERLFDQAGVTLADMDCFGVTVGPGSFTGIRVGLVTVKAWSYAASKPIIAVNSLRALAYISKDKPCICVIDGSNGVSYIAGYGKAGEETLSQKCIYTKDLDNQIKGIKVIYGEKTDSAECLRLAVEDGIKKGIYNDYNSVMPVYIRKSQPERKEGEI